MQSDDFYRNTVFETEESGYHCIGQQVISHPFTTVPTENDASTDDDDDDDDDDNDKDTHDYALFAYARKSNGQALVSLKRFRRGEDEIKRENLETICPRIHIRQGDDVLRLQATMILFHLFNEVWKRPVYFRDPLAAPFCVTYDVVAITPDRGIMEALNGEFPLLSMHPSAFTSSRNTSLGVKGDLLTRSSAGAMTAGFILGLSNSAGTELSVADSTNVFWSEIRGLFEQPIPQPRLSIPQNLRECLQSVAEWDRFRETCVIAFRAIRTSWDEIFSVVAPLFAHCDLSPAKVNAFVQSRWSLNFKTSDMNRSEANIRKWLQ